MRRVPPRVPQQPLARKRMARRAEVLRPRDPLQWGLCCQLCALRGGRWAEPQRQRCSQKRPSQLLDWASLAVCGHPLSETTGLFGQPTEGI